MKIKCALCREYKDLLRSHIIPKFVIKWMKSTGTDKLRVLSNINQRIEDGMTRNILCEDCETKFSRYERYFANNFFYPIINDLLENEGSPTKIKFEYNELLYKFCVSVLWRALFVNLDDQNVPSEFEDDLVSLEKKWRNFLLSSDRSAELPKIYMVVLDRVEEFQGMPPYFNQYVMRMTDATVIHGENFASVFSKMARFNIFAPIIGLDDVEFENSLILNGNGTYIFPQIVKSDAIASFYINRSKEVGEYWKGISENQKKKIIDNILKNEEKLKGSDLRRSIE